MEKKNFIYKNFARPAIFLLNPETAHDSVIFFLKILSAIPFSPSFLNNFFSSKDAEKHIFGLKFKNSLGLAAGFDKNAEVYDTLSCLGFGFIEVGTVTLKPQPGNEKPRLFRFPENMALVNRMGFNNAGAKKMAENIAKKKKINIPLGISIGKNTDCSMENAPANYGETFKILHTLGDFFTINVSCPNVKDLKLLMKADYLLRILEPIKTIDEKKPLFIKISPDIEDAELKNIIDICLKFNLGIIASNTLPAEKAGYPQKGGLSGRPISYLAIEKLQAIRKISKEIPVISSGGIFTKKDYEQRLALGADLAQIYSALIYEGPFAAKNLLSN